MAERGPAMSTRRRIEVSVNGRRFVREVEPRLLLSDFLRGEIGTLGVHVGCEQGVCGACTVLLDGIPARSCLTLAVQVDGSQVTTVEGLASEGQLHPVQEAFRDHHALQCGFCTPGMLLTAVEFLRRVPTPSEEEIRLAIAGNLCRCTGYQQIVEAVNDAARRLSASASGGVG